MTDAKKPPAFFCPDCGQKHRTSLENLEGKAGALMHLQCVGCKTPLAISLGEDGRPVCVRDEPAAKETASADRPDAGEAGPKAGGPPKAPVSGKRKKKGPDAPTPKRKRAGKDAPTPHKAKDPKPKG